VFGCDAQPVSSQGGPAVHSKDGYHPYMVDGAFSVHVDEGEETIVHFVLLVWQKTLTIGCCLVETNSLIF